MLPARVEFVFKQEWQHEETSLMGVVFHFVPLKVVSLQRMQSHTVVAPNDST